MRARILVPLGALLAWPWAAARAQGPPHPSNLVLEGRVTDTAGAAIPRAEIGVHLDGALVRVGRTDAHGRFRLEGLPAGPTTVRVRRLGYEAQTFQVNVDGRQERRLDIALKPVPQALERVRVAAKGDHESVRLREFYEHREQAQLGYFLDPGEIAKRRPLLPSDLLRHLPGVRLLPATTIGSRVRLRGCRPLLWIDAVRVPDAEFDETVSVTDIAALEVYNSLSGIPAQFVDRESNCGAIVVWTRS